MTKNKKNNNKINTNQKINNDKSQSRREELDEKFNIFLEKIKTKKNTSIENFEKIRDSFLHEIDTRIAELYKKRDFLFEIQSNRLKLLKHKISVWKKIKRTKLNVLIKYIISMPFIYMMWIPAIILHIFLEIYHQICFRLYKIPLVKPKEYFVFDRRHLPYLNWLEKINCFYCSYFNCLIAYTREIAGRTERYWCPIKHSMKMKEPHSQYSKFYEHGNAKDFRKYWKEIKKFNDEK